MELAILAISFRLSVSQPGHAHVSMLNHVPSRSNQYSAKVDSRSRPGCLEKN